MIVVEWVLNNLENILISIVFGAGGAITTFFTIGKNAVGSWIDAKFATQLEKQRSDLAVMFDRKQRFYSKEYEVLPELWGHLNDAYVALKRATVQVREFSNLDVMPHEEALDFLNNTDFSRIQKEQVLKSKNKDDTYSKIQQWKELVSANKSYHLFREKLSKGRIFLEEDIKQKLDVIDDLLFDSWLSRKEALKSMGVDIKSTYNRDSVTKIKNEIEPLMKEIERLVYDKLEPNHAALFTALDSR